MNREHPCAAVPVPASIAAHIEGYTWSRNTVGESGGAVYHLHGQPDLYLKHGRGTVADDLLAETTRLRWLSAHIAVPAVRQFSCDASEAWLLMDALPGRTAYELLAAAPERGPAIVDAISRFLQRLHAIPVTDCPFNSSLEFRLARAHARMVAGLVDEDDFDDERAGQTAAQVWQEMTDLLPMAADPVVTHGDFSLDNLFVQDGEVAGCIDVGRAGIADRYQDLAILHNCLGDFGPDLQRQMFESYGVRQPDQRKLRFHLMLDAFF